VKIFAFMGASGVGKSTIEHSLPIDYLVNYTTREIRDGEVQGQHIIQVTRDEFEELDLALRTDYAGNSYGIHSSLINKVINGTPFHATTTKDSIEKMRNIVGKNNVVAIYIKPPSTEELELRMRLRGDSEEKIRSRVEYMTTSQELENEKFSDYVIVNDKLDEAILHVHKIVICELAESLTLLRKSAII
jgi:guanylate kinase